MAWIGYCCIAWEEPLLPLVSIQMKRKNTKENKAWLWMLLILHIFYIPRQIPWTGGWHCHGLTTQPNSGKPLYGRPGNQSPCHITTPTITMEKVCGWYFHHHQEIPQKCLTRSHKFHRQQHQVHLWRIQRWWLNTFLRYPHHTRRRWQTEHHCLQEAHPYWLIFTMGQPSQYSIKIQCNRYLIPQGQNHMLFTSRSTKRRTTLEFSLEEMQVSNLGPEQSQTEEPKRNF